MRLVFKEADSKLKWWVTPYVSKTIGGGTVWAGVNLVSNPNSQGGENVFAWAIPIAIMYSF